MQKIDKKQKKNVYKATIEPGLNFRLFRSVLGKTGEELGEELGVCKSTISNIERSVTLIKPEYLRYLWSEYGLNINWLLTGKGKMFVHDKPKSLEKIPVNQKYVELFQLMQISEIEKAVLETMKVEKARMEEREKLEEEQEQKNKQSQN